MKYSRFPVFIKSRYIRSIFPLFILIFIFFNTELKNIKSIEDSIVQAAYGSRGIMYIFLQKKSNRLRNTHIK